MVKFHKHILLFPDCPWIWETWGYPWTCESNNRKTLHSAYTWIYVGHCSHKQGRKKSVSYKVATEDIQVLVLFIITPTDRSSALSNWQEWAYSLTIKISTNNSHLLSCHLIWLASGDNISMWCQDHWLLTVMSTAPVGRQTVVCLLHTIYTWILNWDDFCLLKAVAYLCTYNGSEWSQFVNVKLLTISKL